VSDAVKSVQNQYLSSLLLSFFDDLDFVEAFKNAPASLYLHHNWVGGLIEHICSVLDLAEAICQHYPELDRDLLVTGVLLHDVGKIREYSWQTDIDRTDEGRLLGHLVLGDEMVAEKIKQIPNFPPELAMRVRHMLISHHGVGDWGSPRPPMTLEAAALHFLEFTDAQLRKFTTVLKERREPESAWTAYERTLGRRLFAGYPVITPSVEPMPTEEVASTQTPVVAEPLPTLDGLPTTPPELGLIPSELEALTTELPELPSELLELPETSEYQPLTEPEEEQPRRRKRRTEPPEEGRLPL
jgi:3'-5' exoribonuclease